MPISSNPGALIVPFSRWSDNGTAFSYKGAALQTRFRDYGTPPSPMNSEEAVLTAGDRTRMIARLADLSRNNEYVAAIGEALATSVGTVLLRSISTKADNAARDAFFYSYFQGLEASGENLDAVLRIICDQLLLAGEVFVNLQADGKISLIEASFIGSERDVITKDGSEVQGVLRNSFGKVTGYRAARLTDKGTYTFRGGPVLDADKVIHIFRKDRPNQVRGVPWLAAAINPLQDLGELSHAKVQQAKNGAMLSMVIKSNQPPEAFQTEGGAAQSQYKTLKTGAIYYLERGEDVETVQSTTNAGDYNEFTRSRLECVLATVGMPLEVLFGYRESSYASSKATSLIWKRKVTELRGFIEQKFLNRVYSWRVAKAVAEKDLTAADNLVNWNWSLLSTLDPQRDATVNTLNLRNNLTTLAEVYADKGQYWEEGLEQRARELQKAHELATKYGINPQLLLNEAAVSITISPEAAAVTGEN